MAEMKDQGGVQRMHFCSDRKNLTVKKNTCAPLKNYSLLQQKWQKQSDPDPEYNWICIAYLKTNVNYSLEILPKYSQEL